MFAGKNLGCSDCVQSKGLGSLGMVTCPGGGRAINYNACRVNPATQISVEQRLWSFVQSLDPGYYNMAQQMRSFMSGQIATPPVLGIDLDRFGTDGVMYVQRLLNSSPMASSQYASILPQFSGFAIALWNQYKNAIAPYLVQQTQADLQAQISAQNDLLNTIAAKQDEIQKLNDQISGPGGILEQLVSLTTELGTLQTTQAQAASAVAPAPDMSAGGGAPTIADLSQTAANLSQAVDATGSSIADTSQAIDATSAELGLLNQEGNITSQLDSTGSTISAIDQQSSDQMAVVGLLGQEGDITSQLDTTTPMVGSFDQSISDQTNLVDYLGQEGDITSQMDNLDPTMASLDQQSLDQSNLLDQLRNELASGGGNVTIGVSTAGMPSVQNIYAAGPSFTPTQFVEQPVIVEQPYSPDQGFVSEQAPEQPVSPDMSGLTYVGNDDSGNPMYVDANGVYYDQTGAVIMPPDQSSAYSDQASSDSGFQDYAWKANGPNRMADYVPSKGRTILVR